MVKHQQPPAQPVGADLKAGPVAGERVRPACPWGVFCGGGCGRVVFAVVEHHLEAPVVGQSRKLFIPRQVRGVVAVEDAFEVAVGADDPMRFAGGVGHVGAVFGLVEVADGVAAVIEAQIQQPAEDPGGVGGVGDAALRVLAVQVGDVAAADGAPVHISGCQVGPAFDAGEPGFHPWPVGAHSKVCSPICVDAWGPGVTGFLKQPDEVFIARKHEHVGVDGVVVAGQAFGGLAGDRRNTEVPAQAERAVAGPGVVAQR